MQNLENQTDTNSERYLCSVLISAIELIYHSLTPVNVMEVGDPLWLEGPTMVMLNAVDGPPGPSVAAMHGPGGQFMAAELGPGDQLWGTISSVTVLSKPGLAMPKILYLKVLSKDIVAV